MNKIDAHKGKMVVELRDYTLRINNGETTLEPEQLFKVIVEYWYEPEIKATEDEPPCLEYVEILSIKAYKDSYFKHKSGISACIPRLTEIKDMMYDYQYAGLEDFVCMEVHSPLHALENYDSVNLQARIELGFGLTNYERN